MSYELYKVLHLLGVVLLFFSLGAIALHGMNGGDKESNKSRALVGAFHGVALLLLLVAGFGLLAKLGQQGVPPWVWLKLVLWLLLGGALVLVGRKPQTAKLCWFALPLLGLAAIGIAIFKPGGY